MSVDKIWDSSTLVERLYNELPDVSLSVEAGAMIQQLSQRLVHAKAGIANQDTRLEGMIVVMESAEREIARLTQELAEAKAAPVQAQGVTSDDRSAALMDLQYDAGARAGFMAGRQGDDAFIDRMDARSNGAVGTLKAAQGVTLDERAALTQIYDLFGIGSEARSTQTLMVCLRNTRRFADMLHAVEREFFMVPGDPDDDYPDDEPDDECLLNCWGSTVEQYVEQFRAARAILAAQAPASAFQSRVQPWMMACFGDVISADVMERNHRFLEEALELVQACGATAAEAHQLVDYVYGRPVGEKSQEVGGVMVTLAALCLAQGMDMHAAGETELARIWTKVEAIRAKQAAKPQFSPLPGPSAPASDDARRLDWLEDMSVDLLSHDSPNGEDMGDTFFTVIQHHMDSPHEREIGIGNTVRKAIDAAISAIKEQS